MKHYTRQVRSHLFTIRQMMKSDISLVIDIERECYSDPLKIKDLNQIAVNKAAIMRVGEIERPHTNILVSYLIGVMWPDHYEITSLAVTPYHRRQGYAGNMVSELKNSIRFGRRKYLEANIAERDVQAQLFLHSQEFKCVETMAKSWGDDDGYIFRFPGHAEPEEKTR